MSAVTSLLRLQVVAAHGAGWDLVSADKFRGGVSTVVSRVGQSLRTEHPSTHLQLHHLAGQAGSLGNSCLTCVVAILDVTHADESLTLLVGRLQGARVPCILLCQTGEAEAKNSLGLNKSELLLYAALEDLFLPDSSLQQELLRAIPQSRIHEELIYQFWFPRETSAIWIVCPQIHNPGEFADRSNPDYTYLDNLGDTDALLEVMVFLSRYYPTATIERFSSRDLPEGHTSGNLVVIGGPGAPDDIGNQICLEMMREVRSRVSYSEDCEQMTVTRLDGEVIQLRADYQAGEKSAARVSLRRDQGYFARFPNPLNENATVVLINGIHTAGVLGAAKAFGERREALRNFHCVLAAGAPPSHFECCFAVQVLNGQVKIPLVARQDILSLVDAVGTSEPTLPVIRPRTEGIDDRASVRVLFIAGDRGGSQVNQLQIPNEYHAIQGALRACRHREVIALANPILAATRERLAEAYRERPAVVHFAGHGNDRRLSILQDHGLLANETPLDVRQLSEILRTMERRVRLCILNACESGALARELAESGVVDCTIGWPAKITDSTAVTFSRTLYGALGDGRTVADAVTLAVQACEPRCEPLLFAVGGADAEPLVNDHGDSL